jgi:hypothetical protein
MATGNISTLIATAVTDLTAARAACAAFITQATASGAPASNASAPRGNAVQVVEAQAALHSLDRCLQELNQNRYKSGSQLDATLTVS